MRLGPDGGSWKKGIYELEPTRQGSSTISHQCDHNLWNEGVSDCKTPSPFSSLHHMRVIASERKEVSLRNLSGGHRSDRRLEMEIWGNEKASMLPVSKDVSMGRA